MLLQFGHKAVYDSISETALFSLANVSYRIMNTYLVTDMFETEKAPVPHSLSKEIGVFYDREVSKASYRAAN